MAEFPVVLHADLIKQLGSLPLGAFAQFRLPIAGGVPNDITQFEMKNGYVYFFPDSKDGPAYKVRNPYGGAGHVLWVRETWWEHVRRKPGECDLTAVRYDANRDGIPSDYYGPDFKRRSATSLPRWASRYLLRIRKLSPARLCDMASHDVELCGAESVEQYIQAWKAKWGGENPNPWVWAITFDNGSVSDANLR